MPFVRSRSEVDRPWDYAKANVGEMKLGFKRLARGPQRTYVIQLPVPWPMQLARDEFMAMYEDGN